MPTTTGKKIAIVTGSALGLGYELASQLIANGWLVAGVDFNAERQAELTAQWPDDSYRAFVGDITDADWFTPLLRDAAGCLIEKRTASHHYHYTYDALQRHQLRL